MSDQESSQPEQPNSPSEQVRAQHVSARVPEAVSRGVFSTGVILMTGGSEFVVDFIQNIGNPATVAARVIMPHGVMPQFIDAVKKNYEIYKQRFGEPSQPPRPAQQGRRPTVQEIYDELKMPDDVLSGAYANALMVGHTASEFKLDFLTNLYPQSAVSCRVYVSAPQIPRMLESLGSTYQQFVQRVQQQQQQKQQQEQDPSAAPAEGAAADENTAGPDQNPPAAGPESGEKPADDNPPASD